MYRGILPQSNYLSKFEKRLTLGRFWQYFCKNYANYPTISENLCFVKLYTISKNHDHSSIFALVALLQRNAFLRLFSIFNSILIPKDDLIAKIWSDLVLWQFSRKFRKSNWFCSRYLRKCYPSMSSLLGCHQITGSCFCRTKKFQVKMVIFANFGLDLIMPTNFEQLYVKHFFISKNLSSMDILVENVKTVKNQAI